MRFARLLKSAPLLLLAAVLLSSCFVRKRVVTAPGTRSTAPLQTATKEQLIAGVHQIADPLESFSMRMDMSPSVGSLYVGEVKDYATLGGYILFRKPDGIRILGRAPMVSTTIFDMVSLGETFRIHIPSKNRFIQGRNDVPPHSTKQVENLRPVAFLISLIIRRGVAEHWLLRSLHFDRQTMQIVRQKTFDSTGGVLSDTTYAGWKMYDGVPFPSMIDIKRPLDHYEVVINVTTLRINAVDVTPEKFVLNQPEGTELQQLQ